MKTITNPAYWFTLALATAAQTRAQVTPGTVEAQLRAIRDVDALQGLMTAIRAWDLSGDGVLSLDELKSMSDANKGVLDFSVISQPQAIADFQTNANELLKNPPKTCGECTPDFNFDAPGAQSCSRLGFDPVTQLRSNLLCASGMSPTVVGVSSTGEVAVIAKRQIIEGLAVFGIIWGVVSTIAAVVMTTVRPPDQPTPAPPAPTPAGCSGETPLSFNGQCFADCPSGTFELDDTTCVAECPADKFINGNLCLDACPPNDGVERVQNGKRFCVAKQAQADICPSGISIFAARQRKLTKRQQDQFPLSRFTFGDNTCNDPRNQQKLVTAFSEAITLIRRMKQDMDATLAAIPNEDAPLPTRSNMATVFGPLKCNKLDQCRFIKDCVDALMDYVVNSGSEIRIETCSSPDLAALAPSRPPQIFLTSGFLGCSTTDGLRKWNTYLPATGVVHELTHALCPTTDYFKKDGPRIYYENKLQWERNLQGPNARKVKTLADAYRVWGQAILTPGGGTFPQFGRDPQGGRTDLRM
ncbi:hypothetical protein HK102_008736 [Quaeritorhiza haematococci]|nr:hypothetical protein HK102_008736 [Quaeritorhiza haematococci]